MEPTDPIHARRGNTGEHAQEQAGDLRATEARYRAIYEAVADAVIAIDEMGSILAVNPAAEQLLGYRAAEMIGQNVRLLMPSPDRERHDQYLADYRRTGVRKIIGIGRETVALRKDGTRFPIQLTISETRIEGRPVFIGQMRDITERKQAEQALRDSEEKFRSLFETANDAIFLMEADTFVQCNSRTLEMFGCDSKSDLLHHTPMEFSPALQPDGRDSTEKALEYISLAHSGRPLRFYWKHHRKDGTPFDAEVSLNSLILQGQTFLQAIVRDVSERERSEVAVQHNRNMLAYILNSIPQTVFWKDRNGVYMGCNDVFARAVGLASPDEIVGKTDFDLPWPKHEAESYIADDKEVMESVRPKRHIVEPLQQADGTRLSIDTTKVPLTDSSGRVYGVLGVYEDITERKAAEARIVRLGQLYEALSKCNQAIVHCDSAEELLPRICRDVVQFGGLRMAWFGVVDETTGLVRPAAAFGSGTEYLGGIRISVSADDPAGRGPVGTAIRENRPTWFQDFQNDPRAAPWHERAVRQGWAAVASLPMCMKGKPIGALSIYSDVANVFDEEVRHLLTGMANEINFALDSFAREAERKRAEEALLKAKADAEQANQAKDQFIAMLSHELRTPLTPILLSSTAMEGDEQISADIRAELGSIRRNVELEIRLIDDLLDVTKISHGMIQLHQEVVDAHACFRNTLEICRSEIDAKHLHVALELGADQPYVWADPARLQQIFWNLLRNAVKFTPDGGQIRVLSTNIDGRLRMEFSDTGIGIEPAMLPRLFDAFAQAEQSKTRKFGGLGLGLSIARAVVELHHGTLTAFSEGTNKGATFTLEMATLPDMKAPPAAPSPTLSTPSASQTILLVEDNADTLRLLARMLRKWGYTVRTADCVRSAMEEAAKQPFDLLVSDIGLPDGSGLEIMQETHDHYGVTGIAISGFGTEEDIRQSRAAGFGEHLVKPVSIQDLHQAVERIASKIPGSV